MDIVQTRTPSQARLVDTIGPAERPSCKIKQNPINKGAKKGRPKKTRKGKNSPSAVEGCITRSDGNGTKNSRQIDKLDQQTHSNKGASPVFGPIWFSSPFRTLSITQLSRYTSLQGIPNIPKRQEPRATPEPPDCIENILSCENASYAR